jgi:pantothenate kinase
MERLMIAISGVPGAGKTALALELTKRINVRWQKTVDLGGPNVATFVPLDGYHYTRAHLATMPDPELAFARRGAHWTFDAQGFLELVRTLRPTLNYDSPVLFAPSFSHEIKDPVRNDIFVPPSSRLLIFEGNYLALDLPPWDEIAALMDELWFVEVDPEVAKKRLIKRHVEAGIVKDEEEAIKRIEGNDIPNGEEIIKRRLKVHEIVKSIEDESWIEASEDL